MIQLAKDINAFAVSARWIAQTTIFIGLIMVGWMAMDREPPFVVMSVEPAAAKPGDWITIKGHVKRDLSRHCSASWSRYVFDSGGKHFVLESGVTVTDQLIRDFDRIAPGQINLSFRVPQTAAVDEARVESILEYRCNRTHLLWPIEVTAIYPFEVLGP